MQYFYVFSNVAFLILLTFLIFKKNKFVLEYSAVTKQNEPLVSDLMLAQQQYLEKLNNGQKPNFDDVDVVKICEPYCNKVLTHITAGITKTDLSFRVRDLMLLDNKPVSVVIIGNVIDKLAKAKTIRSQKIKRSNISSIVYYKKG